MLERIRFLVGYRELLRLLIVQELALRYRHTVLGFLWSLLNPVITMAILAIVFHFIIRLDMRSYTIFLLSSLLPWLFFANTLTDCSVSIIQKRDLISRQPIPKLILPLAVTGSNFVNLLLSFTVLVSVAGVIVGSPFGISMLYLPLGFACLLALAIGLGAALAAATVYLRDIQQIVGVLLPAWMYATPILYPLETPSGQFIVPEEFHFFFKLNPVYSVLQLFVRPVYWGTAPLLSDTLTAIAVSLIVLLAGLAFFWWREDDLVFRA